MAVWFGPQQRMLGTKPKKPKKTQFPPPQLSRKQRGQLLPAVTGVQPTALPVLSSSHFLALRDAGRGRLRCDQGGRPIFEKKVGRPPSAKPACHTSKLRAEFLNIKSSHILNLEYNRKYFLGSTCLFSMPFIFYLVFVSKMS